MSPTSTPSTTPTAGQQVEPVAIHPHPASDRARWAAEDFLTGWVEHGRVIRRDQGADTVSEGQAYGMLAAVTAGDEGRFDEIWEWTRTHLQRPDGLLAWHWDDGALVDTQPASDGDIDAARALILAGALFERPDLTAAGDSMAATVLDQLTVTTASYGRILLPGPWARHLDAVVYNPSYASPAAFQLFAARSGDPRWKELLDGSRAVLEVLLQQHPLPPDWVTVSSDGTVTATSAPGGEGEAQYGYDAPRVLLRYAESCDATDRDLAARPHTTLRTDDPARAPLTLGGEPIHAEHSALHAAAVAAAAHAAGDAQLHQDALAEAVTTTHTYPTYYGRAWAMLAVAMHDPSPLNLCATLELAGS